jgi:hypothetical protein
MPQREKTRGYAAVLYLPLEMQDSVALEFDEKRHESITSACCMHAARRAGLNFTRANTQAAASHRHIEHI